MDLLCIIEFILNFLGINVAQLSRSTLGQYLSSEGGRYRTLCPLTSWILSGPIILSCRKKSCVFKSFKCHIEDMGSNETIPLRISWLCDDVY